MPVNFARSLGLRFRSEYWGQILGHQSRIVQNSIKALAGQDKLFPDSAWSFLSPSFSTLAEGSQFQKTAMAVSASRAILGDCHFGGSPLRNDNSSKNTKQADNLFNVRSIEFCREVGMRLKRQEWYGSNLVCGHYFFDTSRRSSSYKLLLGVGLRGFHSSSSLFNSAGTAPDVSFHGSARDDQHASSEVSSDQKILGDRTLKLLSGSCYLPHPAKEKTGGEDAHFICEDKQVIGLADGVGGWADVGVDAGQFARELMSNSLAAIQDEPKGSIDPARVLEKAHSITKAKGSSTACIVALTNQGIVHAINLGDSGFLVIREGCTLFRSPTQQHGFNITYQLESGNSSDLPSSGQVFTVPVAPGDVIVAGTDGLFDNLYTNDISAVVVHAVRAGFGPQVTAQKIAALARQRALDKDRQTPFSTAAQDAGFRYYGGKLDDITVIVSYITLNKL